MANNDQDRAATKMARSVFAKRGIDLCRTDFRVTHGICFIRGQVGMLPGVSVADPEREVIDALKVVQKLPDVRQVVAEYTIVRR